MTEAGKIPPADTDSQSAHDYSHVQLITTLRTLLNNLPGKTSLVFAELGGAPTDRFTKLVRTEMPSYKLVYDARVRLKQALLTAGWTERHVREVLSARSHDA